MSVIGGHIHCLVPALASIRRGERNHVAVETIDWHNHGSIRQHLRDAANSVVAGGGVHLRSPRHSAIRRGTHLNEIVLRGVVPFRIAMSVIGTGGRAIADNPILVGRSLGGHGNRVVPIDAIGRATHRNCGVDRPDGKHRNQPDIVERVVGDGRVAGSLVESVPLINRDAGQIAIGPGRATIRRGGEPNVGSSSTVNTRDLKGGYDGRAMRKRARFDLAVMLAGAVGKRVLT